MRKINNHYPDRLSTSEFSKMADENEVQKYYYNYSGFDCIN